MRNLSEMCIISYTQYYDITIQFFMFCDEQYCKQFHYIIKAFDQYRCKQDI